MRRLRCAPNPPYNPAWRSMKQGKESRAWVLGASVVVVLLLGAISFQIDSLEKQLIAQSGQLRALGESGERMAAELKRIQGGGEASSKTSGAQCVVDKPLHPEVPDLLQAAEPRRPPPGVPTDGEFRFGWSSGDPKTLNPILSNAGEVGDWLSAYVDAGIADRNRWTDPDKWHGELGCRVELTDEFKEYTIYLRHGVKWHVPAGIDWADPKYTWLKGEHPLTAQDFVFALDMITNPQVENGFSKSYFEDLESWKALDDYTLVVRWKKRTYQSAGVTLGLSPLPRFLYAFAEDGTPYPKETIGLKFNQHWYNNRGYLGVGAYRLKRYEPGRVIELERNEDYYGEKPPIARVAYPIYTDQNQTVLKLKSGEVDLGGLRAGQYREEVLQWKDRPKAEWPSNDPFLNDRIHCQVVDAPVFDYIGWNGDKPMFSDARVRTAMTLALRRREIIDKVFVGLGDVAMGPFLPETGCHDPSVDPLEFDLERAKKLLQEAGWSDSDSDGLLDKEIQGVRTPFEFTLLIYAAPEYTAEANIFKEDLLKLGIRLKIESAEWSLMQKKMDEKQFDAFTGAWGLGWETDAYQIWHSSQADIPKGSNRVGFRNKEADKLIEQARVTFGVEERRTLFRRIHRLIYDAQPYTFVRRRKLPYCWSDDVKGVAFARLRPQADFSSWYVSRSH
ncbi:MAG TPA: ABC transporter substrate-binding protein [Polyangiaceae bacterium]|nr:ABC transporter substrate-binding protein [Polyangiaceae bacterium]